MDDPGLEADLLAGEPHRIAGAVDALVMLADDRRRARQPQLLQQLGSDDRVGLDETELLGVERTGLGENRVGDGDLADVVQPGRRAQVLEPCLVERQRAGDLDAQDRRRGGCG